MDRTKLITDLRTAARRSLDSAEFEEVGAAHHRPEFERCIHADAKTEEMILRAQDLYLFVILAERNARQYRADAEVFAAAAEMLERDQEQ
jgi:hypothetical protein